MRSSPLFFALVEAGRGALLKPNQNRYFLDLKDADGNPVHLPVESNHTLFTPLSRPLPIDTPVHEWTGDQLRLFLGIELHYGNYEHIERMLPMLEGNPEDPHTQKLLEYRKLEAELADLTGPGMDAAFARGASEGTLDTVMSEHFNRVGEVNRRLDELKPELSAAGLLKD